MLEHLAGNIQRQIGGVDDTLYEAEILGQEFLAFMGDEHPADIELQAGLGLAPEEIEGAFGGHEHEGLELHRALGRHVDDFGGLLGIARDLLIELVVFLWLYFALALEPDGFATVEGLRLFQLLPITLDLDLHLHRVLDEVGVLANDLAEAIFLDEVTGIFAQVEDDVSAAPRALGILDSEGSLAVGFPFHGSGAGGGRTGDDGNAVGRHERGIEANAELPDQFGTVGGVGCLEGLDELPGAGSGDGAEVLDDLIAGHANAVVRDHQRARGGIGREVDSIIGVAGGEVGLRQGAETEFVDGVCRIGDQLAQKDLSLGIEGVNNDIEQLLELGLELMSGRCRHGSDSLLCLPRSKSGAVSLWMQLYIH